MEATIAVGGATRVAQFAPGVIGWEVSFEVTCVGEPTCRATALVVQGPDSPSVFARGTVQSVSVPEWVCQVSVMNAVESYFQHQVRSAIELPDGTLSDALVVDATILGQYDTSVLPWQCEMIGP